MQTNPTIKSRVRTRFTTKHLSNRVYLTNQGPRTLNRRLRIISRNFRQLTRSIPSILRKITSTIQPSHRLHQPNSLLILRRSQSQARPLRTLLSSTRTLLRLLRTSRRTTVNITQNLHQCIRLMNLMPTMKLRLTRIPKMPNKARSEPNRTRYRATNRIRMPSTLNPKRPSQIISRRIHNIKGTFARRHRRINSLLKHILKSILDRTTQASRNIVRTRPNSQLRSVRSILTLTRTRHRHNRNARFRAANNRMRRITKGTIRLRRRRPSSHNTLESLVNSTRRFLSTRTMNHLIRSQYRMIRTNRVNSTLNPHTRLRILLSPNIRMTSPKAHLNSNLPIRFRSRPRRTINKQILQTRISRSPLNSTFVTLSLIPITAKSHRSLTLNNIMQIHFFNNIMSSIITRLCSQQISNNKVITPLCSAKVPPDK